MTTAIDSNISIALWNEDDSLNTLARSALDAALGRGSLIISAPVFAELASQTTSRMRVNRYGDRFRLLRVPYSIRERLNAEHKLD